MTFSCSTGSGDGSAKKLTTRCCAARVPSTLLALRGLREADAHVLELRRRLRRSTAATPTYCASSGSASSTLNAPTMKNVKSAAFEKRSR